MSEKNMDKEDKQIEVVGVIFYEGCQIYHFGLGGVDCKKGNLVIVKTSKGEELGRVRYRITIPQSELKSELKNVIRIATKDDIKGRKKYTALQEKALQKCRQRIAKHELPMKLVGCHYNYNGKRLTFFFTADGRVDFRDLVKDLAGLFGTRIDLKQIGPKDEARLSGGIGMCGCGLCCRKFLLRPPTTSTKMAVNQGLSTKRPDKISGLCGRLMCCLNYEDEYYQEMQKTMPKPRTKVKTPMGQGIINEVRVLKKTVVVEFDDETKKRTEFPLTDIKVVK